MSNRERSPNEGKKLSYRSFEFLWSDRNMIHVSQSHYHLKVCIYGFEYDLFLESFFCLNISVGLIFFFLDMNERER